MAGTVRRAAVVLALLASAACKPQGRSVRAWIETRDPQGAIVAGATVNVDGQALGVTDQRGLFRLKIRRSVGTKVALVVESARGDSVWVGSFVVGTNGEPS